MTIRKPTIEREILDSSTCPMREMLGSQKHLKKKHPQVYYMVNRKRAAVLQVLYY